MGQGVTRRQFLIGVGAIGAAAAVGGGGYAAANWAPEADAEMLRARMGDGMSKVLVVYGTGSGCTSGIAEQIGKTLAENGATVDVKPATDKPDASAYDAVVVGSGVRGGTWHAPVREWVKSNSATLKSKPLAMFTVGLMIREEGKRDEVAGYGKPVVDENGLAPIGTGLFAGWNEPKSFSLPERLIMKVMKAPQGDFRDMAAVSEWTRSVAPQLIA
jgi:menaquinone-dependent protoporphyrinogen oxidase